jgi:hypothetical protein
MIDHGHFVVSGGDWFKNINRREETNGQNKNLDCSKWFLCLNTMYLSSVIKNNV